MALALGVAFLLAATSCHLVFPHHATNDGAARREVGAQDLKREPRDARPDLGCLLGRDSTGACRSFAPSNAGTPQTMCPGPLTITSLVTIDTSACTVTPVPKPCGPGISTSVKYCVIQVDDLRVEKGATLAVRGDRPLILLAKGEVVVEGLIDVGAHGGDPGPGGARGGLPGTKLFAIGSDGFGPGAGKSCHCPSSSKDDCGGGGAGFGSVGAKGGEDGCATPTTGGSTYGDPSLVPLEAGSGGASGADEALHDAGGLGGAGGGALQISAQGGIRVAGAITAGGGGGQGAINCAVGPGCNSGNDNEGGGGGGGSGGAILLEAPAIKGGGWVAANGGGGGGGSFGGTGGAGVDGRPDGDLAAGGLGKVAYPVPDAGGLAPGHGGHGATGTIAAKPGGLGDSYGGGGGGRGRIRLLTHVSYGKPVVQISGELSEGDLLAQ